jgi:cytochrome c oxidase subunit 2
MPIVVRAVPQEEFDTWIADRQLAMASMTEQAERQWAHQELVSVGEGVYQANCMSCHQAEGQGIPGMFPAIAGSGVATGSMDKHIATVMNGIEGTMMGQFSEVLSDSDIAAVITYQRNAFGNSTGDLLQPSHIKSLREGLDISAPSSVASLPESNTNMGVN